MTNTFLYRSIVVITLIVLCCYKSFSQTHVISLTTYNYFQGVKEFPDSIVKVFMTNKESKSWRWDFAQQAMIGSNLKSVEIHDFTDSSGALFTIPAEKIHVVSLPDGNTVLGIDQFHCDIDIASVLVILSDSGYVKKEITIDPNEGWGRIQKIGLARHDLIGAVIDDIPYYFDLEGNRVEPSELQTIYNQLIPFGENFIGLLSENLEKLDSSMLTLEFGGLSDSILHAYVYKVNNLLVLTSGEVLIYNDQLELQNSTGDLNRITAAREINDRIWVGTQDGLYELDTSLNVINFFPDSESEQIIWLGDWRDSLLVITQYDGLDHAEIAVRKFGPQEIVALSGPDISISQIKIPPDQVKVRIINCPSDPGIHIDSMLVTVVNHSGEVITNFKIGCDFSGPGQCRPFVKVWLVDTVTLQPHQSIDIFIDSFSMNCVFPLEFCAWTFSPNDIPDANPTNDKFCDTIHILNTNPPVENRLINTTFFDRYISHQILPDGTIRFFFHSNYRYPETTYADLKPGQSLEEIQPQTVYVPDSDYWNWSSDGFVSLPFADGSTLLMNTIYPCDVAAPGTLVKMNKDGGIEWYHDVEEGFYRAGEMMFLDSNRIGIKGPYLLTIDRDGNIISFQEGEFPYSRTIETWNGYVVSKDNQLLVLNSGFHVVNTYPLSDNIIQIWPQEGNEFIIKAGEKFYLLDSLYQLETLKLGNEHYDVVWKSKDYYWAVDSLTRYVDKFFPNFPSFLSRGIIPPGVNPIFGVTSGNNVFVLTEYLNAVSKGILIYTGGSDNVHLRLQEDIGISAITIPDTVHVYASPSPIIGWTYRYDSIRVEVTNYGFDTVYHYKLQALDDLDCWWCGETKKIWEIDTPLAPGETVSISLGAFNPRCVPYKNLPFCITTLGPNGKADKNVDNDKFCQGISNIIVAAKDISPSNAILLYPNPADEEVSIHYGQDNVFNLNLSIFNSYGVPVESMKVTDEMTVVNVAEYVDGMYFVNFTKANGQYSWKKFVVLH